MRLSRLICCTGLLLLLGAATATEAQPAAPPSRAVHVVVPYPAGGIADRVARDLAGALQKRWRQTVIVENRPGASGNVGFEWALRQPADGHTLLLAPASNLTLQPVLFKSLSYDLNQDIVPISLLVQTPQVLLVNSSVPASTPRELVDHSRRHPASIHYGVPLGSYAHLAGEMLKGTSGADFTAIPYPGAAPALNDLLGGQTQFGFNEVTNALPHLQGGRVKAIAVAYAQRSPRLPQVPTMAELGYPGFEVTSWYALVARRGTPQPLLDRLARDVRDIVRSPSFTARYAELGAVAVGSTPDELARFIEAETRKWTPLARQAGIEVH